MQPSISQPATYGTWHTYPVGVVCEATGVSSDVMTVRDRSGRKSVAADHICLPIPGSLSARLFERRLDAADVIVFVDEHGDVDVAEAGEVVAELVGLPAAELE